MAFVHEGFVIEVHFSVCDTVKSRTPAFQVVAAGADAAAAAAAAAGSVRLLVLMLLCLPVPRGCRC